MNKKKIILSIFTINVSLLLSCSLPNNVKSNKTEDFFNINYSEKKDTQLNIIKSKTESFKIESLEKFIDEKKDFIKSEFYFKKEKHPDVVIDKVVLSESNKQIDDKGIDSIIPDFSGKKINITVFGKFEKEDFKADELFYVNEKNLLQLSYAGEEKPQTKFLFDNAILLQPTSSSKNYINLTIDTKYIPDFYLKGLHKLTIITDKKKITSTLIRFGEPVKPDTTLTPSIDKIEVLKDVNKIVGLKLTGKNYMLCPSFTYVKIDGVLYPIYQTDILNVNNNSVFETIVNLSSKQDFLNKNTHTIEYYTPFGMTYTEFNT